MQIPIMMFLAILNLVFDFIMFFSLEISSVRLIGYTYRLIHRVS